MADRAKLFKRGGSQAVQLPKGDRFQDSAEVLLYSQGSRVILEPLQRRWSRGFLALAGSAQAVPIPTRRRQLSQARPKTFMRSFANDRCSIKRSARRHGWHGSPINARVSRFRFGKTARQSGFRPRRSRSPTKSLIELALAAFGALEH